MRNVELLGRLAFSNVDLGLYTDTACDNAFSWRHAVSIQWCTRTLHPFLYRTTHTNVMLWEGRLTNSLRAYIFRIRRLVGLHTVLQCWLSGKHSYIASVRLPRLEYKYASEWDWRPSCFSSILIIIFSTCKICLRKEVLGLHFSVATKRKKKLGSV